MADSRLDRRTAGLLADLLAIGGVGALLVGLHYALPAPVRTELALDHRRVEPLSLLVASYVHADEAHLWANVLGYLAGAGFANYLCRQAGRRRWFRYTFVAFLLALPVAVNLTDLAVFALRAPAVDRPSLGFSGVVAGFGGFTFVVLLVALRQAYSRDAVLFVAQFVVVLLTAELYLIYADPVAPVVVAALALGLAAPLLALGWHGRRVRAGRRELLFAGSYVAAVALALTGFVVGLFPADMVDGNVVTNVFAHAAGFVWGALLSRVTLAVGPGVEHPGERSGATLGERD